MRSKTLTAVTLGGLFAVLAGLLVLTGCSGGSSSPAPITGTPTISLSPTTLTFSSGVNVTSAAQTVTVSNSGTADLTFSSVAVSPSTFAIPTNGNNCGTGIAAGISCSISVTFTPTAAGAVSGTLTINDNASGSPHTVSLSGTGGVPTLTFSPTSLTFGSQGVGTSSAPQSVTVSNTSTIPATIPQPAVTGDFSVTGSACDNVIPGTTCIFDVTFTPTAVGTRTGALTFTDNASGNPQKVSLMGTGVAASGVSLSPSALTFTGGTIGSASAAQSVTLANASTSAITSISISASAPFSETNNCGSSLGAGANCKINVTFTPTASGTANGTLTVTDSAETLTVSLTGSASVANTAQVTVSFGPNGYQGPPAASATSATLSYYNGIYTTVTVCEPGTTTCVNIPNVLVDTGSVGLRVLSSALTGVSLSVINDGSGDNLNECTEYGDGSFNWGPVALATVQIGGETASQVPTSQGGTAGSGIPIQIISTNTVPNAVQASGECVPSSATPDDDTVATLGSNGILGIGTQTADCAYAGQNYCTSQNNASQLSMYPYWLCTTGGTCQAEIVSIPDQVWNPVAAFSSSDTAGVALTLPSIPAAGQTTATGTLTFGINSESNNALTGTVYEVDGNDNFNSATYNGVTYTSTNSYGSFLDSGSNFLYVSDAGTLGISDCIVDGYDFGLYCPSSTLNISLGLTGVNGTSGTAPLSIGSALNLFSANTSFAAFNDIGAASCVATTGSPCTTVSGVSPDSWDLGMPFFFGRTIFIGIAGSNASYPNGYWAF